MNSLALRRVGFVSGLVVLAQLVGCNLLKRKTTDESVVLDAPEASVVATPPPPPVPSAAAPVNAGSVARFADEKKLDSLPARIEVAQANVRKAPGGGTVITTLSKGTPVVQLAAQDDFVLASFDNPKDKTQRMMGWIGEVAFRAIETKVDAGRGIPTCKAGDTPLLVDDEPFCGKVCSNNAQCPAGSVCEGNSKTMSAQGKPVGDVKNCVRALSVDAGAVAVDAGAGQAADAGTTSTTTSAADAAVAAADASGASALPAFLAKPGPGQKCEANFKLAADGLCHRPCLNLPNVCQPGGKCGADGVCVLP